MTQDRLTAAPKSTSFEQGMAGRLHLRLREWLRRTLGWGALALGPNLAWEVVQLPLYSTWYTGKPAALTYAVAHCTIGDGMIAAATYLATATITRSIDWPRTAPLHGLVLITAIGTAYTAWSEYRNVYVAMSWAYASSMPTIGGIGLSPLLQWLVLPAVTLFLMRRWQSGSRNSSAA